MTNTALYRRVQTLKSTGYFGTDAALSLARFETAVDTVPQVVASQVNEKLAENLGVRVEQIPLKASGKMLVGMGEVLRTLDQIADEIMDAMPPDEFRLICLGYTHGLLDGASIGEINEKSHAQQRSIEDVVREQETSVLRYSKLLKPMQAEDFYHDDFCLRFVTELGRLGRPDSPELPYEIKQTASHTTLGFVEGKAYRCGRKRLLANRRAVAFGFDKQATLFLNDGMLRDGERRRQFVRWCLAEKPPSPSQTHGSLIETYAAKLAASVRDFKPSESPYMDQRVRAEQTFYKVFLECLQKEGPFVRAFLQRHQ